MKYLTLGAIDIGSNSIRLLISHVIPTPTYTYYKKVSITRLPVRLGSDVFTQGEISKETGYRLVDAMRAFAAIMRVNGVTDYRACATSAMRCASSKRKLLDKLHGAPRASSRVRPRTNRAGLPAENAPTVRPGRTAPRGAWPRAGTARPTRGARAKAQ
jgi:hypothetical protein